MTRPHRPGQTRHVPELSYRPLIALAVVAALIMALIGDVWIALRMFGSTVDRLPVGGPTTAVVALFAGQAHLGHAGTTGLAAMVAAQLVLAGVVGVFVYRRRARRGSRVDRAAAHMGQGRDVAPIRKATVAATAKRLGVTKPGLVLGIPVRGANRQPVYSGWEDVALVLFGPRQGKTTSVVIPAIVDAPGSVISTSNKRDVVDATRDVRAATGKVWVFDPQQIAGEQPTWWWNPLSYVTDEMKARDLAATFADAARPDGSAPDAYFDPAARDLLGNLILAAAVAHRPITQVFLWLTRQSDDEPADILAAAGYALAAAAVRGAVNLPTDQRGGVYGTAIQMVSFIQSHRAAVWVTPTSGGGRPEFSPEQFVRADHDTIYLLSKEGNGSAGPLVTALTVALTEAAEDWAKLNTHGRLPVPLVVVLDEAANVCRWSQLPAQYSHYGSRGICVFTILQSWSQGETVWGKAGMSQLWSAATVKVVGSGLGDVDFLADLSQLIGDYLVHTESHSTSSGSRNRSVQTTTVRILDVSELASLPKGRAVVLAAGGRPTLVRTLPWMAGPQASAIRASIVVHDPRANAARTASSLSLLQGARP